MDVGKLAGVVGKVALLGVAALGSLILKGVTENEARKVARRITGDGR